VLILVYIHTSLLESLVKHISAYVEVVECFINKGIDSSPDFFHIFVDTPLLLGRLLVSKLRKWHSQANFILGLEVMHSMISYNGYKLKKVYVRKHVFSDLLCVRMPETLYSNLEVQPLVRIRITIQQYFVC